MHDSKPPASDAEGQARGDESQDAAKIPPPVVFDAWYRGTRYTVRCPGVRCRPQNVGPNSVGNLTFDCFASDCPMARSAVTD